MCCTRLAGNAGPKKIAKNSPSGHHRTTLSGYIFTTKAHIDNLKKLVKQQYLLQMSAQYGELRPTNGWDRFGRLGHPYKFQRVLHLASVTAWHSSSGHQPNVASLNRAPPIFDRAAITLGIGPHSSMVMPHIHLIILIPACWSANLLSFFTSHVSLPCNIQLCTDILYNFPHIGSEMMSLLVRQRDKLSAATKLYKSHTWKGLQ